MVKKADLSNLNSVIRCLDDSLLQEKYFSNSEYSKKFFTEAINRGEIYIYEDDNVIKGFFRLDPIGMFSTMPLIRCLAVHADYRNRGIGMKLLTHIEGLYKEKNIKIFLCVSEFNPYAKRLYENLGYFEFGQISGLYRKGITEHLLLKEINNNE